MTSLTYCTSMRILSWSIFTAARCVAKCDSTRKQRLEFESLQKARRPRRLTASASLSALGCPIDRDAFRLASLDGVGGLNEDGAGFAIADLDSRFVRLERQGLSGGGKFLALRGEAVGL